MRNFRIKTGCLLICVLLAIGLATGCSKTVTISDEQTDNFREQIRQDHPAIEKTTLEFSPLTFRMTHTLKESIDQKEKESIFEDSRQFLMSDRFDQEVVQSPKIANYFSSGHPNFAIIFRSENADAVSRFELHANNEQNADPVYGQWYYAEGDETLGEPFAEENK